MYWFDVVLMLGQRRRRCSNIKTTSHQCIACTGMAYKLVTISKNCRESNPQNWLHTYLHGVFLDWEHGAVRIVRHRDHEGGAGSGGLQDLMGDHPSGKQRPVVINVNDLHPDRDDLKIGIRLDCHSQLHPAVFLLTQKITTCNYMSDIVADLDLLV